MDKDFVGTHQLPFLTVHILQSRIAWSIRLRWLSLCGFFLVTLAVKYSYGLQLPYDKIWTTLEILAFVNVLYFVLSRLAKSFSLLTELAVLIIHIVVDLLFLTIIVHLTGGIENPIYLFYIFHVVMGSIVFPHRVAWILATFVILLFGLLLYLENTGILYHYTLYNISIHNNQLAVILAFSIFSVTVYVSTYICTTYMLVYRNIKRKIDQQNEQLIDADKQKTQFFQYTSHELKSPIIAVKSSIDGVCKNFENSLEDKASNLLKRASLRCDQMLAIINELLILTKNRSLVGKKDVEEINIHKILKAIIHEEKTTANEKNIKIEFNPDKINPQITGNISDFEKVFTNLISNAIRYNIEGGKVLIFSKIEKNDLLIRFQDTGIGIPETDLKNIFTEFYRSENARKIVNFGTGLGMSLVKQIIDNYHGSIEIKSKLNEGTIIIIKIPLDKTGGI